MSANSSRHRRFCGTLNFSEAAPAFSFTDYDFEQTEHVTFMIGQCEVGANGTEHLQFYLECDKAMSVNNLLSLYMFRGLQDEGYSLHFTPCNGTAEQNIAYCTKVDETTVHGTIFEFGTRKQQGKRNDLVDLKRAVEDGASVQRLYDEHFGSMLRYGTSIINYKRRCTKPRDFKTIVFLFVGPSGTGKSRTMHTLAQYLAVLEGSPDVYNFPLKHTGFWCDDYDGQKVCILDEMDGNRMVPTMFNLLCDRHPCVLPAHGSAGHQFVAKYLLIGSNYLPKHWWPKAKGHKIEQTLRRIDATIPMLRVLPPKAPVPNAVLHGPQGRFVHVESRSAQLRAPPSPPYHDGVPHGIALYEHGLPAHLAEDPGYNAEWNYAFGPLSDVEFL